MKIEEFLRCVAEEPARDIRTAVLRDRVPMDLSRRPTVAEIIANSEPTGEYRVTRYAHILGPGASTAAVQAWQARWPSYPLPHDLLGLITQFNGIHLWADVEEQRSYEGLAPIEEWLPARTKMYGPTADPTSLHDRYLALSYHTDGSAFVVLDPTTGKYFLMDCAGADETCPIGSSAEDLLGWFWSNRIEP